MTAVVDQSVVAAGAIAELPHRLLDHVRDAVIERVDGLSRLEVDVRVLRGAPDERPLRRQPALTVRADELLGDERPDVLVGEQLDRVQLVRGAKSVEEVHERHAGLERRRVRHERQVMGLLHRRGGQQRKAGLAHRHHVGVVTEDRQPLRRQRASGDVHHGRGQLPGDLVHVRDHQQQALRGGERRRQRTALQRAVQRARRAALALHLDHGRNGAPHVRLPASGPFVGQLGHRRGRGDRVDAADLAAAVGDRCRRLVAVDHRAHQRGSGNISIECTGHWS